ncbi:MAG: cupin domain-containing protein [Lachnospiraceae bacterium]
MCMFKMIVFRIDESEAHGQFVHRGGSARFTVDGQEYVVKEGESIHYPSTLLHSIVNIEDRELVFLCIVTPTF